MTQQDASATPPPDSCKLKINAEWLETCSFSIQQKKKPKTSQIKDLNPLIWRRDVTEIASGSVDEFAKDFFSSIMAKLFWSLTKQHLYSNHIMLQFAVCT